MNTGDFDFNGAEVNGFLKLFVHLGLLTAVVVACLMEAEDRLYCAVGGVLGFVVWLGVVGGDIALEANGGRGRVGLGKNKGAVKGKGFLSGNPF